MSPLNDQQKQLLFDYCIGLTSEQQTADAEDLIASNEEATEIHSKLKAALAPLDTVQPEPCPDDLAERTILRLNNIARTSQLRLQQLLADEQARSVTIKAPFWRNIGKIATAAAVFLIALAAFQSSSNFARQRYRQYACRSQLGGIYRAFSNYMAEYDGKMPAVATTAGAPWWKVGDQGTENYSNTRHLWLLVKGGYVDLALFDCPGRRPKITIRLTPSQIQQHNDFPYREQISYSFRISCPKPAQRVSPRLKALMSDLNTLFETLPRDYSTQLKITLDKKLSTRNSINHNRSGQSIMFDDGRVDFCKNRCIGTTEDDPFTLQNRDTYNGTETPDCETDNLLAP
ncbi:MAG TPA: hypothetical protein VMY06_08825 [Sedimentisphaerales bacterium]|nr:hypothetical protein [Sedimentisphaerales bacterium]